MGLLLLYVFLLLPESPLWLAVKSTLDLLPLVPPTSNGASEEPLSRRPQLTLPHDLARPEASTGTSHQLWEQEGALGCPAAPSHQPASITLGLRGPPLAWLPTCPY